MYDAKHCVQIRMSVTGCLRFLKREDSGFSWVSLSKSHDSGRSSAMSTKSSFRILLAMFSGIGSVASPMNSPTGMLGLVVLGHTG